MCTFLISSGMPAIINRTRRFILDDAKRTRSVGKSHAHFLRDSKQVLINHKIRLKVFHFDDCILHCIFHFERCRNQRQGSEFFLGKWNS